jgi:hypothetical protein
MLIRELIVRHVRPEGAVHVRGIQLNWAQVPAGVRAFDEGADDVAPVQGDLVVVRAPVGPGLREHLAGELTVGVAVALLLEVEVTEIPVGRVLAALTHAQLQVMEAVVVTGTPGAMVAVVAIRTDELITPAPYLAHELEPEGAAAGGQAVLRRLLGEHTLEGLVHRARERALLAQLGAAATKLKEGTAELEQRLAEQKQQEAVLVRDLKSVRGDLDAARREVDKARQQMVALRSSTSFKMASSLARAWRTPRRVLRRSAGTGRR